MARSEEFVVTDESESQYERVWPASRYIDGELMIGQHYVTFDHQHFFNLFEEFPHKFTSEQIEIIRKEMPYWYDFFKDRLG